MTTPGDGAQSLVVFTSFKSPNPHAHDYAEAFVNKPLLVLKKDPDFRDHKKLFLGLCASRPAGVVLRIAFFGFAEEVVKRAIEEHRRITNVFDKNPFSKLSAEERTEQIIQMRKLRLQNLKRDFVVKNIRSSSKEHIKKTQKLIQNPVNSF